jgi:GNAT superfamily N-acetyltransferase
VGAAELTVRALGPDDGPAAIAVINTAAEWYAEFLPPEELRDPEMTLDNWTAEAHRMTWYGAFDGADLVGVMGLECSDDVALFRHAYVLPDRQRHGIGAALLTHLEGAVDGVQRMIVGTYAANYKARAALEKAGFRLSPDSHAVLRRYYDIPEDRLTSSVIYEKQA